jgi:hypothetical protein
MMTGQPIASAAFTLQKHPGTLYAARITAQVKSWQGRKIPWSEIERC